MSAVCRINSTACCAVLDRGFLDALFYISETAAKISNADSHKKANVDKAIIRRVIDSFLLDVIAYPEHRDVVFLHPIYPSFPMAKESEAIQTFLPSFAGWRWRIDFAQFISAIKTSQQLHYLYYTVLPCLAMCWSFIWVVRLFMTEEPFAFDRVTDLEHVR
ncbi:hypothetical protein GALMADRAFT_237272 [Galerina marginata CBS 339.88]|uniref:Uncharacterized protein n=1 Tax=Galerina marginata (strain CBS 339.88) TaxID=685588 RepID=A0A067TMM9_GALM3|nr:hypothetical protein GALMADRAFT_237272 [Galerina marginata CBS 339.88]